MCQIGKHLSYRLNGTAPKKLYCLRLLSNIYIICVCVCLCVCVVCVWCVCESEREREIEREREREREFSILIYKDVLKGWKLLLSLTVHSIHFIYNYMVFDIW